MVATDSHQINSICMNNNIINTVSNNNSSSSSASVSGGDLKVDDCCVVIKVDDDLSFCSSEEEDSSSDEHCYASTKTTTTNNYKHRSHLNNNNKNIDENENIINTNTTSITYNHNNSSSNNHRNHSTNYQTNNKANMVIGAEDLVRIRHRISQLYVKQNVIVAPCLSKLYLSHSGAGNNNNNSTTGKNRRRNSVATPTTHTSTAVNDNVNINNNGNASDDVDWFYFGTGLVAIIYDPEQNDLKLTMFERNGIRLVWSVKWTDNVRVTRSGAPNFHIVSSNSCSDGKVVKNNKQNVNDEQHVGILYENRDVAELVSQTVSLIYDRIKISRKCEAMMVVTRDEPQTTQMPPQGSGTTTIKRTTNGVESGTSTKTLTRKPLKKRFERSSTLKDALLHRNRSTEVDDTLCEQRRNLRSATVHEFSSKEELEKKAEQAAAAAATAENRPKSECCEQARLLRLSRADSFRKSRSNTFDNSNTAKTINNSTISSSNNSSNSKKTARMSLQKSFDEVTTRGKENLVRMLFKKRRISRTQSLQVEDRRNKNINNGASTTTTTENQLGYNDHECDVSDCTHGGDVKQYERSVRLVKPRASTDTMLLCDSMRTLFEAGIAARNQRERKTWMRTLRDRDAQSTDLCVTEL